METRTLMEPVEKYYFYIEDDTIEAASLNRKIRDWLGNNIGCTWETKIEDLKAVGVYFDLDTPMEDMTAFKLRWS